MVQTTISQKNLRRLRRIATRLALTTKIIGGKTTTTLQPTDVLSFLQVVESDVDYYTQYQISDIMQILSKVYSTLRVRLQQMSENSIEKDQMEETHGEKN